MKIAFNGGSWHCRLCQYDLCNSCKESKEFFNQSEEIGNCSSDSDNNYDSNSESNSDSNSDSDEETGATCDNNHRLKYEVVLNFICDICENDKSGTTWLCRKCNYTLCKRCYKNAS